MDAAPSSCDVVGCPEQAVGSYLHSREARLLEFAICTAHYDRLRNGEQPVVADDPENPDGRPALLLERAREDR